MKTLCDPKNDRVVKSVKPPPHKPLSSQLLWDNASDQNLPNWKILRNHMKREGKLLKKDIAKIIEVALEIFKREGNLI